MYDMERYAWGAGSYSGGRLENECCSVNCGSSWDSAAVNGDWMRFFWDWYTDTVCGSAPTEVNLLDLYSKTRLNGGLAKDNYYSKMATALGDLGLSSCLESRFTSHGSGNGIDN